MLVEHKDDKWIVSCREWACIHLGLDIRYQYKSKRNAMRAGSSNLTRVCHYTQKLYARVCHLEIILLNLKKEISHYDFDVADSIVGSDVTTGDTGVEGGCEGIDANCTVSAEATADSGEGANTAC